MKRYEVKYFYNAIITEYVYAEDEEDAKKKILDNFPETSDSVFSFVSVVEVTYDEPDYMESDIDALAYDDLYDYGDE